MATSDHLDLENQYNVREIDENEIQQIEVSRIFRLDLLVYYLHCIYNTIFDYVLGS